MEKTFKLTLSKESEFGGCTFMAASLVGYLVLGGIFLSKWGFGGILFLMLAFIAGNIYYRQSRRSAVVLHTDDAGFSLEILEKSKYLTPSTTRYEWSNLLAYQLYTGKGTFVLVLEFAQAESLSFHESSVSAPFFKYLQLHFPEKGGATK